MSDLMQPQPPAPLDIPKDKGSILKGVGIGLAWMVGASLLLAFTPLVIALVGMGLLQIVWVVPVYLNYRKRGETQTAKGLLILAGLVFLLNAACVGLIANLDFR